MTHPEIAEKRLSPIWIWLTVLFVVSTVSIENAYTRDTLKRRLAPGERIEKVWPLRRSFGWHDLLITVEEDKRFERRLAGHIENGRDSVSDPAFGWHGRRHVVSKADDND